MTHNQIEYAKYLENARHNQATELEEWRSHRANESEINRSNIARELETHRHQTSVELETSRHNVVTEAQGWNKLSIESYNAKSNRITAEANKSKAESAAGELTVHQGELGVKRSKQTLDILKYYQSETALEHQMKMDKSRNAQGWVNTLVGAGSAISKEAARWVNPFRSFSDKDAKDGSKYGSTQSTSPKRSGSRRATFRNTSHVFHKKGAIR